MASSPRTTSTYDASCGHSTPKAWALRRNALMVRVRVPRSDVAVPEISANKYAFNIRFMEPDIAARPHQVDNDVDFELTFCNL